MQLTMLHLQILDQLIEPQLPGLAHADRSSGWLAEPTLDQYQSLLTPSPYPRRTVQAPGA